MYSHLLTGDKCGPSSTITLRSTPRPPATSPATRWSACEANPNEERGKAQACGVTLGETLELYLSALTASCGCYVPYTTASYGSTPDLPSNPTANVDFHGLQRRRVDADEDRLRAWGRAVVALDNPVRRDLHLFMILTGMSRTSACADQVEQLLPTGDALHVTRPKGGAAKTFDLPLKSLRDLMEHRRQGASSRWLFPADSRSAGPPRSSGPNWAHILRHTYRSAAARADRGVS